MSSFIVHYQEIALKGRNRPWFVQQLLRNIRQATRDLEAGVRALMGRIEVEVEPRHETELAHRLMRIFGIANFSRAASIPLDLADRSGRFGADQGEPPSTDEARADGAGRVPLRLAASLDRLAGAILQDLADVHPASFRVTVRRSDKQFPMRSPEIERLVGGRIKKARGWTVNLSEPSLTITIEILPGQAFYYFDRGKGPGGLPTGTGGRVVALLSGGIDSPVAAYRMMKRGCTVLLVHFHSYPILSAASQEKVRQIAALLARFQLQARLALVSFGEIQRQVVLSVPPPLRVVIYRRLMLRIAERIARDRRARALVTGEVIGQVASQTIQNLAVIEAAATLPILRPLVGMDKDEIVAEARRLGTYEISIIPDQDCCQLFTPAHPATRARAAEVEQAEAALPVADLVEVAASQAAWEEFRFPSVREPIKNIS